MTVNSGYQWIGSNTHVTIVGDLVQINNFQLRMNRKARIEDL